MPSIRKSLLQFAFNGAFMKRWNDKLRPVELHELDKQAHKMIAAWALFMLNSRDLDRKGRVELAEAVIEGAIFEYFYRLVITDIKPPVFYQIKANPAHYQRLTAWVLEQLAPRLQSLGTPFWERLRTYYTAPQLGDEVQRRGRRILEAAHLYASSWEFNLIKSVNLLDDEFQEIEASFVNGLGRYTDLAGVDELIRGVESPLGRFTHLCGQLRFQKRWSQTPRIPETSVIGHMFLVACYSYFCCLVQDAGLPLRQNTFFAGLFHDLPELLTRDIISPVKRSVRSLADLIREYEDKELQRRVLGPLSAGGHGLLAQELEFYLGTELGSEFANAVREDGAVRRATRDELYAPGAGLDAWDGKDGETMKVCDSLAAFIEAYTALRNGISSEQLQQALWRLREAYQHTTLGPDLHVGALLADFD
jgi:putative hydrolases of HD superfamily